MYILISKYPADVAVLQRLLLSLLAGHRHRRHRRQVRLPQLPLQVHPGKKRLIGSWSKARITDHYMYYVLYVS